MKAEFDTRQLRLLEADIRRQEPRKLQAFRRVVRNAAGAMVVLWKENARDSAGKHGKRYPRTIGYDTYDGGLSAVVGPDATMPQGGMSFEYGSRNQPPHLDGNRAADDVERVFPKWVADAAELDL